MNRYIIRLTSVTYAIRAQRLLEQKGIHSYVRKLPHSLHVRGCGYGLALSGSVEAATQVLSAAGIRIVEVTEEEKK